MDSEQQSLIHEPDEKQQSLIESYRERLLTSSYHDQHQLQDNDFEVSLATWEGEASLFDDIKHKN